MPLLDGLEPLYSNRGSRPGQLGIRATVFWLYYDDLGPIQRFYEDLLGVDLLVDQGWAKVYGASRSGFIGLVDGARGLHQSTDEKGVTISLFTSDVEAWLERVKELGTVELRTPEITDESHRVHQFVGYDPAGYFLEWDTFLDREGNERLRELLGRR
jgi:predicted enzyme related to lactoylglutathione lyase